MVMLPFDSPDMKLSAPLKRLSEGRSGSGWGGWLWKLLSSNISFKEFHFRVRCRKELRQLRGLSVEVNGGKKISCVLIHSAVTIWSWRFTESVLILRQLNVVKDLKQTYQIVSFGRSWHLIGQRLQYLPFSVFFSTDEAAATSSQPSPQLSATQQSSKQRNGIQNRFVNPGRSVPKHLHTTSLLFLLNNSRLSQTASCASCKTQGTSHMGKRSYKPNI